MDEYSTYSIYIYFAKGTLCDVKSIYSFRYVYTLCRAVSENI